MTLLVHLAIIAGAFTSGYALASWRWRRTVADHLRGIKQIGLHR